MLDFSSIFQSVLVVITGGLIDQITLFIMSLFGGSVG
jgi:hypothetical protein